MITLEAALSDIDKLIVEAKDKGDNTAIYLLSAQKVMLKFLSTMRSNQLLTDEEKVVIAKARKERQEKEPKK